MFVDWREQIAPRVRALTVDSSAIEFGEVAGMFRQAADAGWGDRAFAALIERERAARLPASERMADEMDLAPNEARLASLKIQFMIRFGGG